MEHCRKTLVSKLHGIYSALNDNLSFGLNWVHPSILLSAPGNVAPIKDSFSAAFCLGWGGGGGSLVLVLIPRDRPPL